MMTVLDARRLKLSTKVSDCTGKLLILLTLKILGLAAIVYVTNVGFWDRVQLLIVNDRYDTLVPYVAIWGISLASMLVAALQPIAAIRYFWAILIALSTAVGWGYFQASQSELSVFDILSLWTARHEAGRAAAQYEHVLWKGLALFGASLLVMALGPVVWGERSKRVLTSLAWVPAVPVLAIAGIVYLKSGGGSQSMPQQFTPLALAGVTGVRIAMNPPQHRMQVPWSPSAGARQDKLVIIVDESIRGGYLSFEPGNALTPHLAASAPRLIDYGMAISGGTCSHYSNAILRFMVNRSNIIQTANTNPTIWDFAKKAGYRTVFIDAQAGSIKNASALQNFMTVDEKGKIDNFHALQGLEAYQADERLVEIIGEELKKPGPVFIYANKNGAHFPYDNSYPLAHARFRPTIAEAGHTQEAWAASYMNAIAWSVDRLWPELMQKIESNKAIMIYTSDHGQVVEPTGLTHCHVDNADIRAAAVPLLLSIPEGALKSRYASAAPQLKDKASHFMIPATILDFMGYSASDYGAIYKSSLLNPGDEPLAFTSGDIFGLMSDDVIINPANPLDVVMEPASAQLLRNFNRSASVQ